MNSFPDELVVAMARELRDDDRLFTGVYQPEVVLAASVARRLWAPGLRWWAAGTPLVNPASDEIVLGRRSFDRDVMATRSAFFWQARAFDAMGSRSAVCFGGGLQIDGRGNANLAGIRTTAGWRLRGPGSAGLPSLTAWAPRFYLVTPRHDQRTLVAACSRVSIVGDPQRRAQLGYPPGSLRAVLTPLARFDPTPDGLVLTEVACGASVSTVADSTGFEIRVAEKLHERPPVSDEERILLKELRGLGG